MEHLNKQERNSALIKFLGVYLLSVALPVVGCLFYMKVPSGSFQKEIVALKKDFKEQQVLLTAMDSLSAQTLTLLRLDQSYGKSNDDIAKAENKRMAGVEESAIDNILFRVKQDSAKLKAFVNKQLATHLINTYNTLITYRNTIALQRDVLDTKDVNSNEMVELRSENRALTQRIDDRERRISEMSEMMKRESVGRDYAGKSVVVPDEPVRKVAEKSESSNNSAATTQIANLKAELDFTKADCNYLRANGGITNWYQRKQFYQDALDSFKGIANNSPNNDLKQRATQKINELTQKLAQKGD